MADGQVGEAFGIDPNFRGQAPATKTGKSQGNHKAVGISHNRPILNKVG